MAAPTRTLTVRALGIDVDLRCAGPRAAEARAALAERWSLCTTAPRPDSVGPAVDVWLGDGTDRPPAADVAGDDLAAVLVGATHRVTFHAISGNAGGLLMFHAAGLCHPTTGATVAFVAPGGTGKTTVCRTLGPGRGYVTDESVGITDDGTIAPYAKPLSVRRAGGEVKDEVDPRTVGLALPSATPTIAAVLLLDRREDAGPEPQVTRLDPFDALTALAPESSALDRLDRPLHRLHDLCAGVDLLARVSYAEASSLAPLVDELIGPPAVVPR